MEVLNQLPKYNLFGLEEQDYKSAKVVVLPIPYDSTLTYKTGARNGPAAIISASRNIELYSYELGRDVSKIGIYTLDELAPDLSSPENMIKSIEKEVRLILNDKKIPLLIGGEHTVTLGAIKALGKKDYSVIQFDAHSDTRDEMYGSKYMHATVMARARELCSSVMQIGIRSIDEPAAKKLKDIIYMSDIKQMSAKQLAKKIANATKRELYITIDIDVLDPSEMPSVGTPEPDGMHFSYLCDVLRELSKSKKLIGMDVVELSPTPNMHAPDYLAAKLIYLSLGYFLTR